MPALRLRSGQAPAGIQEPSAPALGYPAWIPAVAGMTLPRVSPHLYYGELLVNPLPSGSPFPPVRRVLAAEVPLTRGLLQPPRAFLGSLY